MWLKGLRLHKYSYLFQQLSYEEMLGITEEWLERQVLDAVPSHQYRVNTVSNLH